MTKIVKVNFENPDPALKEAASLIHQGKIIIYPTDTLYGIGVDTGNEKAIEKVFQIKQREAHKPVLILIAKPEDLFRLVKEVSSEAGRLMDRYWPGPLTMVFEASERVSTRLTGESGKIGIRCPDSPLVRRLLSLTGSPLTATSANLSNESPSLDAGEAARIFGEKVDLILDAGPLISEPSTVIDVTSGPFKVLREGKLKLLEKIV